MGFLANFLGLRRVGASQGNITNFLKSLEGYSRRAYRDPAGFWTIGVGHLIKKSDPILRRVLGTDDLTKIRGMYLSNSQIDRILDYDLDYFRTKLDVIIYRDLTGVQYDAVLSWCFNVGFGAAAKSTLIRRLNKGDSIYDVVDEFSRWIYSNGRAYNGLKVRRAAEASMFIANRDPPPEFLTGLSKKHKEYVHKHLEAYFG